MHVAVSIIHAMLLLFTMSTSKIKFATSFRNNDIIVVPHSYYRRQHASSSASILPLDSVAGVILEELSSSSSSSSSLLLNWNEMLGSCTSCFKDHYYPTQSITNAFITMIGDGVAQNEQRQHQNEEEAAIAAGAVADISKYDSDYDLQRGMVYFLKGLCSGVLWSWWFEHSDLLASDLTARSLFAVTSSSTPELETVVRTTINIGMEQFLVCPLLFSFWEIPFTSVMLASSSSSPEDSATTMWHHLPHEIHTKLGPLLVANAQVWTVANIVTYNIPYQYRILWASLASILSETINAGITSSSSSTVVEAAEKTKTRPEPQRQQPPPILQPQFFLLEPSPTPTARMLNSTMV